MATCWGERGGAHVGCEVEDDFDEYDPTPYGGGYDLTLTFGRPIPPSEGTCYPISISSSTSGDIDYNRPQYSSGSRPSYYGGDEENRLAADGGGYRPNYPRKPEPAYGFQPQKEEFGGGGFGFDEGRRPLPPRQDYGYPPPGVYTPPQSDYRSGYGGGDFGGGEGYRPNPEGYGAPAGNYGGNNYQSVDPVYGSGGGGRRVGQDYGYGEGPRYGDAVATEYQKPNQEEGYRHPHHISDYGDEDDHRRGQGRHGHRHHHHHNYDDE